MSSQTIFLDNPNQEVVLFGKTFTAEDLRNAVIDQAFLNDLKAKLGGE